MFGPNGDFLPDPWLFTQVWWNVSPNQMGYLMPGSQYAPSPAVPGQLAPWTIQPPESSDDTGWPKVQTGPGRIGLLGEAPQMLGSTVRCEWSITFAVPDVPPGTYPIAVLQVTRTPNGSGMTEDGWAEFTVSS